MRANHTPRIPINSKRQAATNRRAVNNIKQTMLYMINTNSHSNSKNNTIISIYHF
jgi:hypothetical protein